MKKEVIVHQDPKAPISEIFRTLRTNMQFMNVKGQLKTILVTSTLPGEGKSWVSANLATTFAQAGKKVILIDGDMRKGRQYAIFNVAPRPGLSNVLSGIGIEDKNEDLDQYIQQTEAENLFVMSAGNVPPNPSELLISPQMVSLLEQLKEIFDIIIIDGTPSQLVTDSLIITRLVDSTLIVTASKETKKEDLKRVIHNIQNVGGKIAGIVINKMPVSTKKYDQSYYYGSTSTARVKKTNGKRNKVAYNRTASMIRTENREDLSREIKKETVKNNKNANLEKMKSNYTNVDKYQSLKNDLKVENKEEISMDKANDILKQINEYLDEEKKKLK